MQDPGQEWRVGGVTGVNVLLELSEGLLQEERQGVPPVAIGGGLAGAATSCEESKSGGGVVLHKCVEAQQMGVPCEKQKAEDRYWKEDEGDWGDEEGERKLIFSLQ